MTTLENRPRTALLVVDVQNGVVEERTSVTRSSQTSTALSTRRGGNKSPLSGSSTPTSSSREGVTSGGSSPSWLQARPSRSSRSTTATPSRTPPLRPSCPASGSGDSWSSARRPTSASARRSTAPSSAGTTRSLSATPTRPRTRRPGAPPPGQVIAHTNLYWTYQTAPGGRPGRSRPRTWTSAACPDACREVAATGVRRRGALLDHLDGSLPSHEAAAGEDPALTPWSQVAPEHEGVQHRNQADEHQDDAEGIGVDAWDVSLHRERQDGAQHHQKDANPDAHSAHHPSRRRWPILPTCTQRSPRQTDARPDERDARPPVRLTPWRGRC